MRSSRSTPLAIRGIGHLGGTILRATNWSNPFAYARRTAQRSPSKVERGRQIARALAHLGEWLRLKASE